MLTQRVLLSIQNLSGVSILQNTGCEYCAWCCIIHRTSVHVDVQTLSRGERQIMETWLPLRTAGTGTWYFMNMNKTNEPPALALRLGLVTFGTGTCHALSMLAKQVAWSLRLAINCPGLYHSFDAPRKLVGLPQVACKFVSCIKPLRTQTG
jgi:hypothetical protein